jgi:hypothetical protein
MGSILYREAKGKDTKRLVTKVIIVVAGGVVDSAAPAPFASVALREEPT